MQTTKFLLAIALKGKKQTNSPKGFTLIELLVAVLIGVLVLTPLLGLAVNLLQTDRKEQAKATSEQELQAAADFMSRDLQQAVFIYNADGIEGIRNQIPPVNRAGTDTCNDAARCQPVLVFWKRIAFKDAIPVNGQNAANCGNNDPNIDNNPNCDDAFVYSLVAYYYILPEPNEKVWSKTARIGRFEIQGGAGTIQKDDGFESFKISPGQDIAAAMNKWTKGTDAYKVQTQTLIDYIDPTVPSANPDAKRQDCPPPPDSKKPNEKWTQTPANTDQSGFYACVNPTNDVARVFMRGNALARYQTNIQTYKKTMAAQFPSATIEVRAVAKLRQ